jgi:hypothetical protein
MKKLAMTAFACLWASTGAALAADYEGLTLGAGLHHTDGDYGTPVSTEITAFVLTGRYETAQWFFKGSVPWLSVSGGGGVIPGIGRVRGATAAESSASGLGDLVLSATHKTWYDAAQQAGLELTGRLKLATADEDEGLGTGEHDFGFQADVFKGFGRLTGFAGLGYTLFGDSPDFPLRNVFNVTFGASYRLDQRDSVGFAYDQRDPVAPGAAELTEIMLFWSRQIDRAWRTQAYFLVGLEDGSPDWGAGLSLTHAF